MTEFTEFTEKLNSSELVSHAWDEIDRDQASAGLLIDTISDEFKGWQPPEPLIVVPEDVDKAIKYLKKNNDSTFSDLGSILTEKGFKWLNDFQFKDRRFGFGGLNNKLFILSHLAITGYTVEKPQLFYLKHIDMSETDEHYDYYLSKSPKGNIFHSNIGKGKLPKLKCILKLTQQEIESLHTGSYEQIEVHP